MRRRLVTPASDRPVVERTPSACDAPDVRRGPVPVDLTDRSAESKNASPKRVSSPSPPSSVSLPKLPVRLSLPSPPLMVSLAGPPHSSLHTRDAISGALAGAF